MSVEMADANASATMNKVEPEENIGHLINSEDKSGNVKDTKLWDYGMNKMSVFDSHDRSTKTYKH